PGAIRAARTPGGGGLAAAHRRAGGHRQPAQCPGSKPGLPEESNLARNACHAPPRIATMTTILILALPGNPGLPQDFDELPGRLHLSAPEEFAVVARPRAGADGGALTKEIEAASARTGAEKVVILAYSWGGYLALRHAAGAARKPDAIALINPTLVAENPLS